MKKHLRMGFRYDDVDAMQDAFNGMAEKGYRYCGHDWGWSFEKSEEKVLGYAVEIFDKGSDYDTFPSSEEKDMDEYCREAGWKLVDVYRRFCIYEKMNEDAVPIHTDEERYGLVKKAGLYQHLSAFGGYLLISIFMVWWLRQNITILTKGGISAIFALDVLNLFFEMFCLIRYFFRMKKAEKELMFGETPYYGRMAKTDAFLTGCISALVTFLILWYGREIYSWMHFLVMFLIAFLVPLSYIFFQKLKPERAENIAFTWLGYPMIMCGVILIASFGMSGFVPERSGSKLFSAEDFGIAVTDPEAETYATEHGLLGSSYHYEYWKDNSYVTGTLYSFRLDMCADLMEQETIEDDWQKSNGILENADVYDAGYRVRVFRGKKVLELNSMEFVMEHRDEVNALLSE